MNVVVDISVVLKWFHTENEAEVTESQAILAAHRDEVLTAHGLTLYDALFAAVAQALDAPLISMDHQLLTVELAETPATFASRVGLVR